MSLKIFPHFTVKCVFLHEELPRERTGSAETQIWALFQIHVLSGQRWYVCDAFGLSIWQEEAKLQEKSKKKENNLQSSKDIVSRLCSRHNKKRDVETLQSRCFSDHNLSTLSQRLSQLMRVREALEILCQSPMLNQDRDLNFRPYSRMFGHLTWFTQAHVTSRFLPYSLEKDAVTASKLVIAKAWLCSGISFLKNSL